MATVASLIDKAFIDLGVIAVGESVSSAVQTDAFERLNQLLSSWSNEQVMVHLQTHTAFSGGVVAGTSSYTVGTAGALVTAARPVRIVAWTSVSGSFRRGGPVISFDELRAKSQNDTARRSVLPEMVAADSGFPNINIEIFPTPDTGPGTLSLDYWTPLVAFAAVGDTVTLPDGYEDALHFNLAVALAPHYNIGKSVAREVLLAKAQNAKAVIVAKNAAILGLQPQAA